MFDRFTDRARRAVVLAQEEARMFGHNYIGTEHILLGLIYEELGVAARSLEKLDVSLDDARKVTEEIVGRGEQAPEGHIPFTPRAKRLLERSLREALVQGSYHIDTEHILLSVAYEGEQFDGAMAIKILLWMDVTPQKLRDTVKDLLAAERSDDSIKREAQAILSRLTASREARHAQSVVLEASRQVAEQLTQTRAEVTRLEHLQGHLDQWLAANQ